MLKDFCQIVGTLNEWTGRIAAWLVIPLTFLVTVEVILRYVLNRPTIWIWDVNVQLLGAMVALGGGYTLLHEGHIGVDVFVVGLPSRKQVIIQLFTFIFFFLGVGVLLWQGGMAAWASVKIMEVDYTFFAPPVYPLKVVMAVGFFLLFLQGVAKFIRDLIVLVSREEGTP